MQRDPRAFLSDVIEAGQAILQPVDGSNLEACCQSRLIRSSVEREFITIGEALTQLSQRDQAPFGQIEQAPQITGFRNGLTHEYIKINNQLVWGFIRNNLPVLVDHCRQLLDRLDRDLP
jgi:uncharacterized protein with HEPN domain